ncbi:hypothetical protein GGP41_010393 [Bipolaris sorokiniana]|uniref:Mid2 domain-containing protein n=2 Tax=Cochliobolus sativus TaxID=45130 RepID=A0A8H5ZHU8_COCSA|nr:hypothetical protein GGP41_010393 [Bipolaris sorokiniana]
MRIAALVPVLLTFSSSVLATCWFPDGQESTLDTACNPDAIVSSCCFDRQACLSNGLCVSDPHDPARSRTHRGTCTDRGWKSGNCVRQCFDNMHAGAPVYSCNVTDVDSYCCYENCKCENPFEVFSFDGTPANVSTMTVILEAFTQTRKPTATAKPQNPSNLPATSFALPTGSANGSASAEGASSSTQGPNYLALGIGLGLGLGLGIPAIFLIAFFFWRRRKAAAKKALENSRQPPELSSDEYYPPAQKNAYNLNVMPKAPQHASSPEISPSEKDLAQMDVAELPDDQVLLPSSSHGKLGNEKQF